MSTTVAPIPVAPDSRQSERHRRRQAALLARARERRRRMTLGAAGLLALISFIAGIAVGSGGDGPVPEASSPAAELDLGALAGQRLIAGWDGEQPPRGLRRQIATGGVAGVILFADNVGSRAELRSTLTHLQRIERPDGLEAPLLVMVDQEGGQVKRLDGPPVAAADALGSRGREFALEQGRATAQSLAGLGINVDLAPVLDVARPGGAIANEQRAFGTSAAAVTETGVDGFAAGLRDGGVAATAKHFPGLGAAQVNTDLAAQTIDTPLSELRGSDELPFDAFIDAGGELVMLSLATYPALADRPASFSPKVVEGELRERLGFEGVTITDGLGAAAAAAFGDPAKVALAAETAGNDLLLYSDWRAARDAARLFTRRLRAGELDRGRFETAVERVLSLRESIDG